MNHLDPTLSNLLGQNGKVIASKLFAAVLTAIAGLAQLATIAILVAGSAMVILFGLSTPPSITTHKTIGIYCCVMGAICASAAGELPSLPLLW
jgi:hypothetical protein